MTLFLFAFKNELLPLWKFTTLDAGRTASQTLFEKFEDFRAAGDFVGVDFGSVALDSSVLDGLVRGAREKA